MAFCNFIVYRLQFFLRIKMKHSSFPIFLFLVIFISVSCRNNQEKPPMFDLMKDTGIDFINRVEDGSKDNSFLFRNFYNGGGVAIGDINNDGLTDIFLTSNMGDNKLYLNKGGFKFDDITAQSNISQDSMWSTGVTFADVNHDGWLDIYVCNSGHMSTGRRKNKLYINNRNLKFTESAKGYGLDIAAYSTHASFFDYDLDGDLDMFLINNSPIPVNQLGYSHRRNLPEGQWPVADFLKGGGDHLYRNDKGVFTEVTQQAGIHGSLISFGLGVTVGDVNADGYPDVYIANDSYERDYLYINQKDGTFVDDFETCIQHTSMSSMGADLADINNDGYQDIFTTDMLPADDYRLKTLGAFDNIDLYRNKEKAGFYRQFMQNCLQVNNGNGKFYETAYYSGIAATDWSWGALIFDADNDAWNDIYVCNGVNRDVTNLDFMDFFANEVIQKMILSGKKEGVEQIVKEIPVNPMPNKMFRNLGNLKFSDAGDEWGLSQKTFSNGAAYGDLDNDGDLDLVVNNENQPSFIYRNNAREITTNSYVGVLLSGIKENTYAIGSMIRVYVDSQVIVREVIPSRGFQSSVDYKVIIGLGNAERIDSLSITWPDRSVSVFRNVTINKVHKISQAEQNKVAPFEDARSVADSPVFLIKAKAAFEKHSEDDFIDFYYERNIPHLLSREGPRATTGDVNGDKLQDVYIGGAKGQGGQLYLQTANGDFVPMKQPSLEQYKDFEDVAVLFFDADKDGDLDLFLGPGGNNAAPETREIQLRLFVNDGKGNFLINSAAFPKNNSNISVAVANDFDRDGDLDLFVGGRSVPREYGLNPESYLFLNDGSGNFKNQTTLLNAAIGQVGMVTDAAWADVSGDSREELVIVGEWMSPRIFSYNSNRFVEVKTNLSTLNGWWQTVAVADVDRDGKNDLLLGNIGENFYLQPTKKTPVKIWINDFDQNGTKDKVLTRTIDGKDKTVFLKNDMQDQIPGIKKQSLNHATYAKKDLQDLFAADLLTNAIVKECNSVQSCVAFNKGNGTFAISAFPSLVQLSSVNAIHTTDINSDGFADVILGGNISGFLPQLGRLDASWGHVLINDTKGHLQLLDPAQSGVEITGEVRDIIEITGTHRRSVLILRNDDYPVLLNFKTPRP
jgi:hypothetical protein